MNAFTPYTDPEAPCGTRTGLPAALTAAIAATLALALILTTAATTSHMLETDRMSTERSVR